MKLQHLSIGIAILFLGGRAATAAEQPAAEPIAEIQAGKAAFEQSCKLCHSLDRPLAKTYDAPTWDKTVGRMIDNGAPVTAAQRPQIVAFLAAKTTFETKCSICHGLDRPLAKAKVPAAWLETVQRMAAKKPGHLDDRELAAVAAYLALERPAQ